MHILFYPSSDLRLYLTLFTHEDMENMPQAIRDHPVSKASSVIVCQMNPDKLA